MSFQFLSSKISLKTQIVTNLSVSISDVCRLVARSPLCHWGRNIVRLGLSLADWLWSWGNDKVRHHDTISPTNIIFIFSFSFQTALPSISSQLYWYDDGNMSDGEHWALLSAVKRLLHHVTSPTIILTLPNWPDGRQTSPPVPCPSTHWDILTLLSLFRPVFVFGRTAKKPWSVSTET